MQPPVAAARPARIYYLVVGVSVLLLLAASAAAQPYNATLPSDTRALQRLRDALQPSNNTTFASWQDGTDPCLSLWDGIACDCARVWSGVSCASTPDVSGYLRVLSVDLSRRSNKGSLLTGTLPASVGALNALVLLDLSYNSISGIIPDGLSNLNSLQLLALSGNRLTGTIPEWLGTMGALAAAWLDGNRLQGPLPDSMCRGGAAFYIAGNANICGRVPPTCTTGNVPDISGTYLMRELDVNGAHACDGTPPVCLPPSCWVTVPDPPYWTSTTSLAFTFTDFEDDESGVNPDMYQWGLGTAAGLTDALGPLSFTGNRTGRMVQADSSSQPVFAAAYTQQVNLSAAGQQLVSGRSYYITVIAYNNAGPRLSGSVSSTVPVLVDATPPATGKVYNTAKWTFTSVQTSKHTLGVSWDNFTDPETGVTSYSVQFFQVVAPGSFGGGQAGSYHNITPVLPVGLGTTTYQHTGLQLADGKTYFARLLVANGAGLVLAADAMPVKVDSNWGEGVNAGIAAIAVVVSSLGCLAIGAVTALLVVRGRMHQQTQREKERQREQKLVKALLHALTIPSASQRAKGLEAMAEADEFAFVITDVEASTQQSAASPTAFAQMQDIHDQVMREGIAKYSGYEITTEGDSFSIAFSTVQDAVQFCMEIQYRLLETNWPKAVLRLPSCKPVATPEGELVWKGPRIRMGIHWASSGTVACRYHSITKVRMFAGPGFHIAQDVGEAAHGGQVLMTHAAWEQLRVNMPGAGFPVVSQLGLFRLQQSTELTWLYQVAETVGKPMLRTFPPPRKVEQLVPGLGLHIMQPPGDRRSLSFVAARLSSFPKQRRLLPPAVSNKLMEVVAMQAQQFRGYLYNTQQQEGRYFLAFEQVMDAVRFCHAAQMLLLMTSWPPEAADFCGTPVPSLDSRWLFRGPRVAMAIHEAHDYEATVIPLSQPSSEHALMYGGPAVTFAAALVDAIRGGQVVLSEDAWDSVKPFVSEHPGASQVVSLGTHVLCEDFPDPVLLMEVMPNLLSRRSFKPPQTLAMLEPGYREAPKPTEPMAIVFVKVQKPEEVVSAERGGQECPPDEVVACISAFQRAILQYTTVARRLLRLYEGYECKEPEPGKFTLCFRSLGNAIRWGATLQRELLKVEWPEELVGRIRDCGVVADERGRVIWSGLRVRIGMSYGYASSKKPLNTGRADYFGPLPNTAARVAALAAPGQVLVECGLHNAEVADFINEYGTTYIDPMPPGGGGAPPRGGGAPGSFTAVGLGDEERVEIAPLGHFLLRGLEAPRVIYQVTPASLSTRHFPLAGDHLPSDLSCKGSRTSRADSWTSKPRMLHLWLWGAKRGPAAAPSASATSRSNQSATGWDPRIAALQPAPPSSSSTTATTAVIHPTHSAPTGQGSYTRQRMSLLAQLAPLRGGSGGSPHSLPADLRMDSFQALPHLHHASSSTEPGTPYRVDSEAAMQGLPGLHPHYSPFRRIADLEDASFSQASTSATTPPPGGRGPSPLQHPYPLQHPLHVSTASRTSAADAANMSFTSALSSYTSRQPSSTTTPGNHPMVSTLCTPPDSPGPSPPPERGGSVRRSVLRALRLRRSSSSSFKRARSKLGGPLPQHQPPSPSTSAVSSASSSPHRKGMVTHQLSSSALHQALDLWPPLPPALREPPPVPTHTADPAATALPPPHPLGHAGFLRPEPTLSPPPDTGPGAPSPPPPADHEHDFPHRVACSFVRPNNRSNTPTGMSMSRSMTMQRQDTSATTPLPDRSFSVELHGSSSPRNNPRGPSAACSDPLPACTPPAGGARSPPLASPQRSPRRSPIVAIDEDGPTPTCRNDPSWILNTTPWRSSPSASPRSTTAAAFRGRQSLEANPPTAPAMLSTPFLTHPASLLSRNSSLTAAIPPSSPSLTRQPSSSNKRPTA